MFKAVSSNPRYPQLLERLHFGYMGVLPALATFVTLWRYGANPGLIFCIFLGGVAVVGVYLAMIISYTKMPKRAALGLVALLDSPLISSASVATTTTGAAGRTPFAFAIENFLMESVTIWAAIFFLAVTTSRPDRQQRIASVGLAIIAWVTMALLVWPYVAAEVLGNWGKIFWLIVGTGEALLANYYILERDEVIRDSDTSSVYIACFTMLWVFSLIGGMAAHGWD